MAGGDGAPGGSLVERVAARLESGPAHTLALARDVLGINGHAGARSATVFALLGSDSRFKVDAAGVWTFEGAPPGPAFDRLRFAVVDVETTGGPASAGHRITEIAVVEVAEGMVSDRFSTLINPGRGIPPFVSSLTGISAHMVASAPYFDHVAPEVAERLRGRVFVAHNASFDYGFVQRELLQAVGEAPPGPVLCTVRLARGLLPRLRRRNLDALAAHFGVPVHDRHRAHGDALATARVLIRLLDEARQQGLHDLDALRRLLRRRGRRRARRGRRGPRGPGAPPTEQS